MTQPRKRRGAQENRRPSYQAAQAKQIAEMKSNLKREARERECKAVVEAARKRGWVHHYGAPDPLARELMDRLAARKRGEKEGT